MTKTKLQLIEEAQEHYIDMQQTYNISIQSSIKRSVVYRDIVPDLVYTKNINEIKIAFMKGTTEHAININDDFWCVLNFASFKYPGGGFLNGAMAQEEALCHASTLYNVISDDRFNFDYGYNRNNTNHGLYSNFAIYSPDIVFEDVNNDIHNCNVITCAAPNLSVFKGSEEDAIKAIEDRIKFVLDVAEKHQQKRLILGAFGCGVFQNDPYLVAHTFLSYITSGNYSFTDVIFAIPKSKNSDAFVETLFHITDESYPFIISKVFKPND